MTDDELRKELRAINAVMTQIQIDVGLVKSETARMQALDAKIERIHRSLDGSNGTPGIKLRLDRLERTLEVQRRTFWIVVGVVATMGGKMLLDALN